MKLKTLLFVILSFLILILWSTTFIAVFNNEKQDIEIELYNNSKNVAQSLSLSLSNAKGDKVLMKTMIDAVFDGGHFKKIVLINGKHIIYKRVKETHEYKVPKWFKKVIKITAPIANANVSNGWQPIGILYVQNDIEYAYAKLYKIFMQLLFIYLFATIISLLILKIILDLILKPLEEIKKQAQAIINKEFKIIKKMPFIKELKEVTIAMNKMVTKLQIMFENASKEIAKLKQKEYIDNLTGLKNRKYYIEKLNSILNNEENITNGANIFITLKNLEEANKKIGRTQTDKLIKELAISIQKFLKEKILNHYEIILARMNGSEFAIFIPNLTKEETEKFIYLLHNNLKNIIIKYTDIIDIVIGAYIIKPSTTLEEILSNTDKAVASAEVNQEKIAILETKQHILYSKTEWKNILTKAIKNNEFSFLKYTAFNLKNKTIHHKTLSLSLIINNKILKYSEFIPAAIHLDLIDDIYKLALKNLTNLNPTYKKYSFKLPIEFISKTKNFLFIEKTFRENKINYDLIIEIPEKFIIEDIAAVKELINILNKNNLKFGIYNFIAESKNFNYIIDLHPEFIKSDKIFYINQKNETLTHLKNLAITTETDLIATGVNEEKYINLLNEKGIYIIQGSITEKLTGH